MKYFEEFRYGDLAKNILRQIIAESDNQRNYCFLDFCTNHAHPIHSYNLSTYLPENIVIHEMFRNIHLLLEPNELHQILTTSKGDDLLCFCHAELLSQSTDILGDLIEAKKKSTDIRIVHTADDAINLAKLYPSKQVVFIAIGFEKEMVSTANALIKAKAQNILNFSVIIQHKTALSAISKLAFKLSKLDQSVTGIIMPKAFMLSEAGDYQKIRLYNKIPVAISGFESIDILQSILYLIRQNNTNMNNLYYQYKYSQVVHKNQYQQHQLHTVFHRKHDQDNSSIDLQQSYLQYELNTFNRPQREKGFL